MAARTLRTVTATQARDAADRIAARRHRCDDPDLYLLSDEPLDVVEYVASRQRVPAEVLAGDVLDALLLLEYIRRAVPAVPHALDALEGALLSDGAEVGLTYEQMAEPLGLCSRQAVHHRIRRQQSAERGGPRNERAEREARRSDAKQAAWAARHAAELLTATVTVVANRDRFILAGLEDDVDHVAELAAAAFPAGQAGDARHREAIRRLAAKLRDLARDVDDWEDARSTTEVHHPGAALAHLLAPVRALIEHHQTAIC